MRRSAVLVALSLLALSPLPTHAEPDAPAAVEQDSVLEKIRLTHQKPDAMMRILNGGSKDEKPVRGTLTPSPLFPAGLDGILAFQLDNSLIVRGTSSAVEALKRGIRVADVKVSYPTKERAAVLLSPTRLQPKFLQEKLLKLPNAGATKVEGDQLRLEGAAAWVDQALRVVVQSEMAEN